MKLVDVAVIGSGPSGREAAVTASEAGLSVVMVEQEPTLGGACVKFGTIPSKALRESAFTFERAMAFGEGVCGSDSKDLKLASLRAHLDQVLAAYEAKERTLLSSAAVDVWHGRASFVSPRELIVRGVRGECRRIVAKTVVIATGSRPRIPPGIAVDHETVLDSDSLLSMSHLPESMAVLGGGVIASEYASMFACLGVSVTMVDRGPRPLGFLDNDLVAAFLKTFAQAGGSFVGNASPTSAKAEALGAVVQLAGGRTLTAERVLVALGRVAQVESLDLGRANLAVGDRGHIPTGPNGESATEGIYVVGDAAGPPSLAASGVEQGRRAIFHALGIHEPQGLGLIPTGVYTIPEMGAVGLTEQQARASGGAVVAQVDFRKTARGLIGRIDGFLKLVADPRGQRILGAHAIGQGAAELVSIAQLAISKESTVAELGRCVFNFPTLGEAYRLACAEIVQRAKVNRTTLVPPSRAHLKEAAARSTAASQP